MDTTNNCPICFESLTDKTVGSPDICDHKFCLPCLEKWSKHGNFCPVDRQIFKKIRSGDKVIYIRYKKRKKCSALYDVSVFCEICKDSKEESTVILCDSCDLAFHLYCLKPPLKSVPSGSWHCPDCQEVARNLKAQKSKNKDNASTCSKQSAIPLRNVTISSSKDESTNKMFMKIKHSLVEQSYASNKDYYQKNLPCTQTNAEIQAGEFEDFLHICDNDNVILTNRKPIIKEIQSLRLFRQARNNLETQQSRRTTKRLAATVGKKMMIQNLMKNTIESSTDDSSSSSGVYSAIEKDTLDYALNADNHFNDSKKCISSHLSSTFPLSNKNEKKDMDKFSASKSKFMNKLRLGDGEGKNSQAEDLNINATSKSFSVSVKSIGNEEKPSIKKTVKEPSKVNSNTDFRQLRKKSRNCLTESRSKRLAASIARMKMAWQVKRINHRKSSDEFSDSLDHQADAKNDSEENPFLNTSNHHLFKNIKKALSLQNSTPCDNQISTLETVPEYSDRTTPMENINKGAASYSCSQSENPGTSAFVKVPDCVSEGINRTESLSVFEKPGWKSFSPSTKINNPKKGLINHQIPMAAKLASVLEKSPVKEPPELILEPLNLNKNTGDEISPELLLEPLNTGKSPENKIPPIMKETQPDNNVFIGEEFNHFKKTSPSEAFTLSENVTDTSCFTKKHPSMSLTNNEDSHSLEGCQNAENSEDDGLSQEIDNFPNAETHADENIVDNFHVRQVHYAIKAKMNLPAELQQIERESWLSYRSKSTRKHKYKSAKKADICKSSFSHHIVAGNAELYNFLKNTQLGNSNPTQSRTDLAECNTLFNPFCQSVSGSCPKKRFKVTEYALQPSDKQVCFKKIPKDVLRSFMGPDSLKHLDIREDGSMFLNWSKCNSL